MITMTTSDAWKMWDDIMSVFKYFPYLQILNCLLNFFITVVEWFGVIKNFFQNGLILVYLFHFCFIFLSSPFFPFKLWCAFAWFFNRSSLHIENLCWNIYIRVQKTIIQSQYIIEDFDQIKDYLLYTYLIVKLTFQVYKTYSSLC